jgi:predicted nucleic acid-binding protein
VEVAESYVVDASVVAKWFNRGEEFEKESDQFRRAWINDEIQLEAPSHLPFEVANSIWKNPNIQIRKAGSLAKALVELSPRLHDLTETMAERAMLIARRRQITFYDASYLTLAKVLSIPLITADDDQLRAASGYVASSHLSTMPGLR